MLKQAARHDLLVNRFKATQCHRRWFADTGGGNQADINPTKSETVNPE
jgi:hypothetical protein